MILLMVGVESGTDVIVQSSLIRRSVVKRFVPVLLTGGLAVSMAGCAEDSAPAPTNAFAKPPAAAKAVDGILVSLRVPNMT